MDLWVKLLIIAAFAVGMEGFAWWFHRYFMHGPGWGWHRDHHEPHDKALEKNDLYIVCFGGVSAALYIFGLLVWEPVYYAAIGITVYGIMYAFVHEGMVHQRWPFRWIPKRGYLRRLVQAHKLHHAVTTQGGNVSFGFVIAPDPHKLMAQLRAFRAERAASRNREATATSVAQQSQRLSGETGR